MTKNFQNKPQNDLFLSFVQGNGCCVGFTSRLRTSILPGVIGGDIGCGIAMHPLPICCIAHKNSLKRIDSIIKQEIPVGNGWDKIYSEPKFSMDQYATFFADAQLEAENFALRFHAMFGEDISTYIPQYSPDWLQSDLSKRIGADFEADARAMGTLGGGNHYIEVNESNEDSAAVFLSVHTGSRSLGQKIAAYHHSKMLESPSTRRYILKDPVTPNGEATSQKAPVEVKTQVSMGGCRDVIVDCASNEHELETDFDTEQVYESPNEVNCMGVTIKCSLSDEPFEQQKQQREEGRDVDLESAHIGPSSKTSVHTTISQPSDDTDSRGVDPSIGGLSGPMAAEYFFDMIWAQTWAKMNRRAILSTILHRLGVTFDSASIIESVHNYIDFRDMVIRKGAVSAREGEPCIVSLNMRDGVLLCRGKGNEEWNWSAPHGCGRIISRRSAGAAMARGEKDLAAAMKKYHSEMGSVYSSCVIPETLDERPSAYRDKEIICDALNPTAEIICQARTLLNVKGF